MSRNQISGSLSLDVSGVADAVHEQIKPSLDHLSERLHALSMLLDPPAVLSVQELADVLARAGAGNAEVLARNLHHAGFSVTVTEPSSPEPVTAARDALIDHTSFLPPL